MNTYKAKQLLLKLINDNLVGTPDDSDLLEAKAVVEDMCPFGHSEVLYVIQNDDANGYADRPLTNDELYAVKKGIDSGLSDSSDIVMKTAVHDAMNDPDLRHGGDEQ